MVRNRWWIFFLVWASMLALAPKALSESSTTQPAPAEWGDILNTIARGLTGGPDYASALDSFVPNEVPIRNFGSPESTTRTKIKQQTEGLTILASRVYAWPADTIATDLASDFRACENFPETLRRQFSPRDDSDVKRTNTIAQLWVNRVLNPGPGQLVGILVLWEPPPPVTTASLLLGTTGLSETKQPYFVLIKGMKTSDGQYHITQIVCGDANQALN